MMVEDTGGDVKLYVKFILAERLHDEIVSACIKKPRHPPLKFPCKNYNDMHMLRKLEAPYVFAEGEAVEIAFCPIDENNIGTVFPDLVNGILNTFRKGHLDGKPIKRLINSFDQRF